MAKKGKEPATQRTLCGDPTSLHKANFQGSRESEHQEVPETPANDTTERPLETQTKKAIKSAKNGKNPIEDSTRDLVVDFVGGHGENLTGGAQSQLQ